VGNDERTVRGREESYSPRINSKTKRKGRICVVRLRRAEARRARVEQAVGTGWSCRCLSARARLQKTGLVGRPESGLEFDVKLRVGLEDGITR